MIKLAMGVMGSRSTFRLRPNILTSLLIKKINPLNLICETVAELRFAAWTDRGPIDTD